MEHSDKHEVDARADAVTTGHPPFFLTHSLLCSEVFVATEQDLIVPSFLARV